MKSALMLFLPATLLAASLLVMLYHKESEQIRTDLKRQSLHTLQLQKNKIDSNIAPILADLLFLSEHAHLREMLASQVPHRALLENDLALFSRISKMYDQVRILDSTGMELIRINLEGSSSVIVPQEQLQSKGDRYYFKETFALKKGELYVSPLDLNIEHGRIEQPLKPMIRFGTPLFDKTGHKRGIIIFNYLAENLIRKLKDLPADTPGRYMLLNQEGYWLVGGSVDEEWGFMYADGKQKTMGNRYPEAWKVISASDNGQFLTGDGLFTFDTIRNRKIETDDDWKIVAFVPVAAIRAEENGIRNKYGFIFLLLFVLFGITSWFLTDRAFAARQRQEDLLRYGENLEQEVQERTFELEQSAGALQKELDDRRRLEIELRLQSSALEAAANAIIITDRVGTIVWINPAFTELTGYDAGESIGKNPRDLVKSGVHDQTFYKRLWDTLMAGEVWHGEITNRRKDDTRYFEEQTITPVKDVHGEITHFIGIKQNRTEQRNLEEQLRHSQKLESIGTLAGGIAHDLNNILAGIIGYGSLALMKSAVDDPQRVNIQNMLDASDRATHLVKELLLFSRKQALNRKQEDLNSIVVKMEKFLKRVIGEEIVIKTKIHTAKLPVLADAYQLEQVLMNLATNARDSMPQGGVLTVSTGFVDLGEDFKTSSSIVKPGRYALLTVSDSGAGMDKETQQRIFEPFFTTKDVGKGTGLGLAVVYGIVTQHEGHITVYSEPGQGTVFRVYLPLIEAEAVQEADTRQVKAPSGGAETILLAEDDEMVRNLTTTVLREFGYTVIEAVDGKDAVKKFKENADSIKLLLFDMIMPKMNGKDAVDEIRRIGPIIKTIFTSGYAPDIVREKLSFEEGIHLITKPVTPAELLRKVREVLDEDNR